MLTPRIAYSMLMLLVLLAGCGAEPEGVRDPAAAPGGDGSAALESNRAMAMELEFLSMTLDQRQSYDTSFMLRRLDRSAPPDDPIQKLGYDQLYALSLLLDGQTEAAVEHYRSILKAELGAEADADARDAYEETMRLSERMLAVAYLRMGEQRNCIDGHNVDSCLLPIREGGVYADQMPSRLAIEAYTALLERDGNDLESRWLLNLAYMTVGEYPESVPEDWRIPPEVFESEFEIPRFPDVAPRLGADILGLSGSAAIEDFDLDGDLDIMASSWGLKDPLRYLENRGAEGFVESTEAAGLRGLVAGLNMVHADYDNDGDADVLVLRGAWRGESGKLPNSLLRNEGGGRFVDVTRQAGMVDDYPTQTALWADFDGDGWLDVLIGNEPVGGRTSPSELYMNQGDGSFRDRASEAGLQIDAFVKGLAGGDYDNDGDIDVFVSVASGPNRLYRNDGTDRSGHPRFVDVAEGAGVTQPLISFPTWFWDYDNDGWLDLLVASYEFGLEYTNVGIVAADYLGRDVEVETLRLYRNQGDGRFEDVTARLGLDKPLFVMGSNFGDIDNDGFPDMLLGTGEPDFRGLMPNRMFRNAEGKAFQDVTTAGGFGNIQKGHGIAFGDMDNDGDQDIYAVLGGAFNGDVYYNSLYENPDPFGHRWIILQLEGRQANRSAIGTRIRVRVTGPRGPRDIHAQVGTGGSFGSNSLQQEIGLGDAEAIDFVELHWPGSREPQVIEGLELDTAWHIVQGKSRPEPVELRTIDW